MASYCTIADVCAAFPQFVRAQAGSIADATIQAWIDGRKTRIRSVFLSRGVDLDAGALSTDEANFLKDLNRDGAIGDLGDALQATVTLQPGEYSLASAHRATYERVLKEIQQGLHDVLFSAIASHKDVRPLLGGTAGAEADKTQPSPDPNSNRVFGKNQVF